MVKRTVPVVVVDSVTDLGASSVGAVAVTGSHGGFYSARVAARAGVRGAVFSDAGRGLQSAGIAGLAWLDDQGIAAAAVSVDSARIGDGDDIWQHGVVAVRNLAAAELGIAPGVSCQAAVEAMAHCEQHRVLEGAAPSESRVLVADGPLPVWAIDSASLVTSADDGAILAIGSHGGLVGGDPRRALKCSAAFAVFNDAGVGKDQAGIGRLLPLGQRGIPAATVSGASARIGDGLSTLEDGVLSYVNEPAALLGAAPGIRLRDLVAQLTHTSDFPALSPKPIRL